MNIIKNLATALDATEIATASTSDLDTAGLLIAATALIEAAMSHAAGNSDAGLRIAAARQTANENCLFALRGRR